MPQRTRSTYQPRLIWLLQSRLEGPQVIVYRQRPRALTTPRKAEHAARRAKSHRLELESGRELRLGKDDSYESLPPVLDTIAAGKLTNSIFEFLATRGGMWISLRRDHLYEATLVGPRWVVRDVLNIAAEWYCARTEGWVSMSSSSRNLGSPNTDEISAPELLAFGITWLLPVPPRGDSESSRGFPARPRGRIEDRTGGACK